jgi:hypothetical protein
MTTTIKITPKLEAALIKLRDADAEREANPTMYNPRTKAARLADYAARRAHDKRREAVDALCEILHKTAGSV